MNSRNRLLIVFALLPFLFLTQSCDELKDLASFDHSFDLPTQSFTVDSTEYKSSSNIMSWTEMYRYDVEVDLQKVLDDNGLTSAEFRDGRFESFFAEITAPEGTTFSFATKMRVVVALNSDFSDQVVVAESGNIEPTATSATFDIEPLDITPYIEAPVFFVKLDGYRTGPLPVTAVDLNLDGRATVTVNPL